VSFCRCSSLLRMRTSCTVLIWLPCRYSTYRQAGAGEVVGGGHKD
jgi:hypothetical protein